MKLCIYIPDFHLQVAVRAGEPSVPKGAAVALLDEVEAADAAVGGGHRAGGKGGREHRGKARIVQRNGAAARLGVLPGMTATQGQARHAGLVLLNRNRGAETMAQGELLALAAGWTRDFESTADGVCTLDLTTAHGVKVEGAGSAAVQALKKIGLEARAGAADNPDLALLVARRAAPDRPVEVVRRNREAVREFLGPLPVESAGPPPEMLDVLRLWGIRTLGDLTQLPRDGVTRRLGAGAGAVWDRAAGRCRRLLRLVRPVTDFSESLDLDYGIGELEPLLFLLQRLLETIAARLEAAYLVAAELRLGLVFDDASCHERTLRVPDPSRDLDLLLRLLETHLDGMNSRAPVVAVTLEAVPSPGNKHQFHLFESGLRDPNRFAETLAQLEALLGSDRVGTPEPLPAHRPDSFALNPFRCGEDASDRRPADVPESGVGLEKSITLGLPLRRFRPPPAARVETGADGAPVSLFAGSGQTFSVGGRVAEHLGPWRISGEWWQNDTRWAREEWDVRLGAGGLYRLAHLESGEWVVEGAY